MMMELLVVLAFHCSRSSIPTPAFSCTRSTSGPASFWKTCGLPVAVAGQTIRQILENQEGMLPDRPPRVHFTDFRPDGFDIQFVYWYQPADWWAFREFSEKVNLEIFRQFEEQGIQFSLPLRHTCWKHDDVQGPLDVRLTGNGTVNS